MTRERMERILREAAWVLEWLRQAHRCDQMLWRDYCATSSEEHVTKLFALCGLEGR